MSLKPCNSLLLALDYHQGLVLLRPAEVHGETIILVRKVNNLRKKQEGNSVFFQRGKYFTLFLFAQQKH